MSPVPQAVPERVVIEKTQALLLWTLKHIAGWHSLLQAVCASQKSHRKSVDPESNIELPQQANKSYLGLLHF